MEIETPIASVDLPGIPDLELRGLIVVVGPNSSGKSQFLHDLNEVVVGRPRQLVVASGIQFREPPSFEEYLAHLIDRKSIREEGDGQYSKRSLQLGVDGAGGNFEKTELDRQHKEFSDAAKVKLNESSPGYRFLQELGPLSRSGLFLVNRLNLLDDCPQINHLTQGPAKTLQSLYWNKNAKLAFSDEITRVFNRGVWVDAARFQQLVVRISDLSEIPPAEDRLEPEIMEEYRTILTAGDGLRSYSAICATLLLDQRPLCLIDEPEMCLHPPQAHAMGRLIGGQASDTACTVVATHSSHVLKGILETNSDAHVIRLTRVNSTFQARTLSTELLNNATSKPRTRSEAILEGLLSDAVVLCEAEGDRLVYESAYRTLESRRLDIRFTPSEGTGGFADPLQLYAALGIPTAVIADIDFLANAGGLKRVLTGLGVVDDQVKEFCARARNLVLKIQSSTSPIDPIKVQETLKELALSPIDLTKNEDDKLRGTLQQLIYDMYKLRELQLHGIEGIPSPQREDAYDLLSELGAVGLFLVPVGELESWLPMSMKGIGREDKSRWAMLAAEKIEDAGESNENVWKFVRSTADFLESRLKSVST